jgi:benzylsuccinate CoA-transferase BbsF subunit
MAQSLPLAGIRVTDFSWIGAGPFTTKFLSDFGADVIRIESATRLDPVRSTPPFKDGKPGPDRSGYYADRNTCKRSITLNLKTARGVEIAKEIIARSDVVANNFSPGTMDRLGLGYADVRRIRQDIIYLAMSMQGAEGPDRDFIGFGLTIGALAGLQYVSGPAERMPVGTGTNYPDHVPNPCHGAFALLAALRHRRRTGEGQFIDLAQTEPTIAVLGPMIMDYMINGRIQERRGNEHPAATPHGVYPCTGDDRWIAICVMNDAHWAALCKALGKPAWLENVAWKTEAGRRVDRKAIDEVLSAETAARDARETMLVLQQHGVPAGVAQNARELIEEDPQLRHRHHWVRLTHPEIGPTLYNAPPFRFSAMPSQPERHAPLLGEHTHDILRDLVGLSAQEIAALAEQGVLK